MTIWLHELSNNQAKITNAMKIACIFHNQPQLSMTINYNIGKKCSSPRHKKMKSKCFKQF